MPIGTVAHRPGLAVAGVEGCRRPRARSRPVPPRRTGRRWRGRTRRASPAAPARSAGSPASRAARRSTSSRLPSRAGRPHVRVPVEEEAETPAGLGLRSARTSRGSCRRGSGSPGRPATARRARRRRARGRGGRRGPGRFAARKRARPSGFWRGSTSTIASRRTRSAPASPCAARRWWTSASAASGGRDLVAVDGVEEPHDGRAARAPARSASAAESERGSASARSCL